MIDPLLMILSLSLSGTLLALLLFVLKPLIRNRLSKAFGYYIWILVLLRLIIPVGTPINAMDSLFTSLSLEMGEQAFAGIPEDGFFQTLHEFVFDAADVPLVSAEDASAQEWVEIRNSSDRGNSGARFMMNGLFWIWAAGAAVSILWHTVTYFRYSKTLDKTALPPDGEDLKIFRRLCGDTVQLWHNPNVNTPMLIGIIHPRIFLPGSAYTKKGFPAELNHILRHELMHYRRKDLIYKWLVVIITSLHWFNPFMYLVRREIARACELSCDEAVICNMSAAEKQNYGNTLLFLASKHHSPKIPVTTLCEGKEQLRERLLGIMKYRKKSTWTIIMSLLLALCLTGCGSMLGVAKEEKVQNPDVPESSVSDIGGADHPIKVEISSGSEQVPDPAPAGHPSVDLDGDGLTDTLRVENFSTESSGLPVEDWKVVLTVELGSGETDAVEIPGWWWLGGSCIADFDTDGCMDIALMLEVGGSNYGAMQVYVYRVENGKLVEFNKDVILNNALPIDESRFESFHDIKLNDLEGEIRWVGGTVVTIASVPMLRLRQLADYSPGENIATAYYMNLSWNGDGWYVESLDLGEAYGEEVLFEPQG